MLYNVNNYLDSSVICQNIKIVKYSLYKSIPVNFKIKDNTFVDLISDKENYDPDNSKIVGFKDNYYYTYYLNSKTNNILKNVKFLLNIGFLDSIIKDGFLTMLYNNGEIIGFKTKKGNLDVNFNQNNKKLIEFYSKFIEKQKKFGILMLDCCKGNICFYNNKFYVFDFDVFVDANIYKNLDIRVNDTHSAYWTVNRGYKKYNKMITELFNNNKILLNKYLFYPENLNN